jgi:hypothetical protein
MARAHSQGLVRDASVMLPVVLQCCRSVRDEVGVGEPPAIARQGGKCRLHRLSSAGNASLVLFPLDTVVLDSPLHRINREFRI